MRLVDLFARFDKNKDWRVSEAEFRRVFRLVKIPVTDQQLENLILALDKDDNGMLDYKELVRGRKSFHALMREQKKEKKTQEALTSPESLIGERISRASTASVEIDLARFSPMEETTGLSTVSLLKVPDVSLTEAVELTEEQKIELKAAAKAKKQEKQRAKQMKLRQVRVDAARRSVTFPERVERHLAPSTVSGPSGDLLNDLRQELKREYDEAVNLCRMNGVGLTRELLEKGDYCARPKTVSVCLQMSEVKMDSYSDAG